MISIIPSSRSLTRSSALFSLLFIAFSSAFISAIEFSDFHWLLFVVSSSLSQWSAFLSRAFFSSFSIFITSFPNLGSGRLERPVSLFFWGISLVLIRHLLLHFTYISQTLNLGETVVCCSLEGCFPVRVSPGSLHASNTFVRGLFLVWVAATSFLHVCWLWPPWLGVWLVPWWPEPALGVERGLLFALWLSQPCWGLGLLPSCWRRSPQIGFWAAAWGGQDWSTSAGKGAAKSFSSGAVPRAEHSMVSPVTCCAGSESALWLALPSPRLSCGNAGS